MPGSSLAARPARALDAEPGCSFAAGPGWPLVPEPGPPSEAGALPPAGRTFSCELSAGEAGLGLAAECCVPAGGGPAQQPHGEAFHVLARRAVAASQQLVTHVLSGCTMAADGLNASLTRLAGRHSGR